MAFALVASVDVIGSSGSQTTGAIDTTGADLIIICLSDYGVPSIYVPTDSKGNTYVQAGNSYTGPSGVDRAITFYCKNPIVGTGHTFSLGVIGHYSPIFVQAWSGAHLTAPFGGEIGVNNGYSATTWTPGSMTPTEDNCLIHLNVASWISPPSSVDSGFTLLNTENYSAGQSFAGGDGYKVQTTAAAVNPSVTFAASETGTLMQSWWKSAGASSSPIAGRSAISTRTSGALAGAAALAGSTRIGGRDQATASGTGALVGSTRAAPAGRGAASGAAALAGSARALLRLAGNVTGAAALAGAARSCVTALALALGAGALRGRVVAAPAGCLSTTAPDLPAGPPSRVRAFGGVRVAARGGVRVGEFGGVRVTSRRSR